MEVSDQFYFLTVLCPSARRIIGSVGSDQSSYYIEINVLDSNICCLDK